MSELLVCPECIRALAYISLRQGIGADTSWNAIARHPEAITDTVCALCQRGPGIHPASDFVRLVVERRPLGADFAEAFRDWRDGMADPEESDD